jgi:hypothetical protein
MHIGSGSADFVVHHRNDAVVAEVTDSRAGAKVIMA